MTLCSSSKKLGMLLPSRWCLRRVSVWGNYIISLHYSGEQWADRRKQENACRFLFFNKQVFKAFDFEDWKWNLGWSCVCMCVSATLIILFTFQNIADLRQALVQPSRAQPPSTEPWDSSLPAEMTGTTITVFTVNIQTFYCLIKKASMYGYWLLLFKNSDHLNNMISVFIMCIFLSVWFKNNIFILHHFPLNCNFIILILYRNT